MKSERRIRIEVMLDAGIAVSDIARNEGVSQQWVHQIKRMAAKQRLERASGSRPQNWKRRPSRAFVAWLESQQSLEQGGK